MRKDSRAHTSSMLGGSSELDVEVAASARALIRRLGVVMVFFLNLFTPTVASGLSVFGWATDLEGVVVSVPRKKVTTTLHS